MPRRAALRLLTRSARALVTGESLPPTARPAPPAPKRDQPPSPPAPAPGLVTSQLKAGLQVLAPSGPPPILLGYYPSLSTNPFQVLLYDRALELGVVPAAMRSESQLGELEAFQGDGRQTVLHVHWLHQVMRDAADPGTARTLGRRFLDRIDAYLALGGRLVWTVHNVLPHGARFPDVEAWLCAEVARRAGVIHVLVARTPAIVSPFYELPPDRVLHVPSPSYAGAYPDHVSPLEARQRLHLPGDAIVYLSIGAIRPYKGLDAVLEAWSRRSAGRQRLVVAGPTTDEGGVAAFVARARTTPGVLVDPRKIPVVEMQIFLRAADIAVLAHQGSLNSGALMLALTFGLPVIVPRGTGLIDEVDESFAVTYDPADPAALSEALDRAHSIATPEARSAALAAVRDRDPATISRRFATELRARLQA